MSKRSITDFFKPYAYPRHKKHPFSAEELDESRPSQRPHSNTPRATTHQQNIPFALSNDTILVSSQSSALSSLHALPSSTPEKLPSPTLAVSTWGAPNECSGGSPIPGNETLSQVHVISSSQRTIRNGKVVIRDSDEDQSDTDTSLDDIDDLLRAHLPCARSSPGSQDELPSNTAPHVTRSKTRKSSAQNQARTTTAIAYQSPIPIASPKYKFSLDALVKKRQQDDDSREVIESAQNLLEGFDERKSLPARTGRSMVDESLLATVINDGDDDGGNIDTLMAAIERTEAFDQQKTWSFFRDDQEDVYAEPADCPPMADTHWQGILEDPLIRQQAFLNGYIEECASFRKLPDELLVWLLDAACHTTRDDLHNSYCQALQDVGDQISDVLSIAHCNSLFDSIGARPESLDLGKPAVPVVLPSNDRNPSAHAKLRRILNVYQAVTASLSLPLLGHMFCILSRLLLDAAIVRDCTTLGRIGDVIDVIVDRLTHDDMNKDITTASIAVYHSVKDLGLQLQLLRSFPAFSMESVLLQRRLALAFFFDEQNFLMKAAGNLVDFKAIKQRLDRPDFVVNSTTNYSDLAAAIAILAIGIDDGDPSPDSANKQAQAAFDKGVDTVAQKIKAMFNQINDTGAAHMKRTDAKQSLESFHSTLVYAVRTKQKAKGGIWDEEEVIEKQKGVMSGFTRRER
ncbi:MAG: hypothetical protein Q9210_001553 [Variospora velana]